MENRPTISKTTRTTRQLNFILPSVEHDAALVTYLKRNYAEFRGFSLDEIEIDYLEDGTVKLHAFKET